MTIPIPGPVKATQNNWRFCIKCLGLFWNGRDDNGFCPHPSQGAHQGVSWDFYLLADPENPVSQGPDLPTGP
jgi:hypothetical protein